MAHWIEDYVFPHAWIDLRGTDAEDRAQRDHLQAELGRELHAGHSLAGRVRHVVARSDARDDVVVLLDRDEAAIVHLTYTSNPPERPPWPATEIVASAGGLEAALMSRD